MATKKKDKSTIRDRMQDGADEAKITPPKSAPKKTSKKGK
jgi:hypothetical protein